jgi:hypothetical protein
MSSMDDAEADARGVELAIRTAAALLASAAALQNPGLGVLATTALPALDLAAVAASNAVRRRMAAVLGLAAKQSGKMPVDLVEEISTDPRKLQLLVDSLRAGAESAWEERTRVLGRALAAGAVAEDDALVDEERKWVAILASIEAPELRIMEYLLRGDKERPGHMIIARREHLARASGYRQLIGPALVAMERNALVLRERGGDQDKQTQSRWSLSDSTVIYKRGELTQACYQRFLDAGVTAQKAGG